MPIPSGVYCPSHLIYWGVYGSMAEEARATKALYKLGILCPSVHSSGVRCIRYAEHDGDHHEARWQRRHYDNGSSTWVEDDYLTW